MRFVGTCFSCRYGRKNSLAPPRLSICEIGTSYSLQPIFKLGAPHVRYTGSGDLGNSWCSRDLSRE